MIRDSLAELMDLFDIAQTKRDRAESLALLLSSPTVAPDFARFLAARAHIIVRGGARALLREMLSTITAPHKEVSVLADIAEEHLRRDGRDIPIHFVRVASTRSSARSPSTRPARGIERRLTIETRAHEVGGLAFSPDGTRLVAFVSRLHGWERARELGFDSSCITQWDAATGEFLGVVRAGQFREGEGAMAINANATIAVVRSHRSMAVHAVLADGRVQAQALRRIQLGEGPDSIAFIDDRTILVNNGHELVIADVETGTVTRRAYSVGGVFVFSPKHQRIFVGGSSGTAIAMHDFTSSTLESVGSVAREQAPKSGSHTATIALSPSEDAIATGDWGSEVRLWRVDRVLHAGASAPVRVPSVLLGEHRGWVSAAAFMDDGRLLTAGWDGVLIEWDLRKGEAAHRAHEHHGYITALTLDTQRRRAATGASDGRIVIWDLDGDSSNHAPPPFVVSYGMSRLPLTMKLREDEVRIVLGTWEAFFDRSGTLVRSGPCAAPSAEVVAGFTSDAIELTINSEDAPSLVVSRGDEVLDILDLDAPALAFVWIDPHSFIALDSAGHVELWSRRSLSA